MTKTADRCCMLLVLAVCALAVGAPVVWGASQYTLSQESPVHPQDEQKEHEAPSPDQGIPNGEDEPESVIFVSVIAATEAEEQAMFPGLTTRPEREMAVAILQVRLSVRKYIDEHSSTVLILRVKTRDECYGFCFSTEELEESNPPETKKPEKPRRIKPMSRPEFEKFASQALQ